MDQLKPTTGTKDFFTQYSTRIEVALSLYSGFLVTLRDVHAVTWINDPLSKAGLVCTTLLNASLVGAGNILGKSYGMESPEIKVAITIVAIGFTFFSAPLLAGPQAAISLKSAIQVVTVHLAGKTAIYILNSFLFPSLTMPTTSDEIFNFDHDELQRYHTYFNKGGSLSWEGLSLELQLTFLSQFEKKQMPADPYTFEINYSTVSDKDFRAYHETIWNVNFSKNSRNDMFLFEKSFALSTPAPKKTPKNFHKNLAQNLMPKLHFASIEDSKKVEGLSQAQLKWCFDLARAGNYGVGIWAQFSLEVQHKLNTRFSSTFQKGCDLFPQTVAEVENCSGEIIQSLHRSVLWPYFTSHIIEASNKRFKHDGLSERHKHPQTEDELSKLPKGYYCEASIYRMQVENHKDLFRSQFPHKVVQVILLEKLKREEDRDFEQLTNLLS